jgi:hypothetical protein
MESGPWGQNAAVLLSRSETEALALDLLRVLTKTDYFAERAARAIQAIGQEV